MNQTVWAVATTELSISGTKSFYVELRAAKNPKMMIPYPCQQAENFDTARKWASGKGVELKFAKQYNRWNDTAGMMEYGKVIELKAPDAMGQRGYYICEECGNKTRSVLDGEAYCDTCQRYQ